MHLSKILLTIFSGVLLTSCVIISPKQLNKQLQNQSSKDIKSEMHRQLLNGNNDTCNLTGLLKILAKNINRIQNNKLDDRINKVKDELIKTYKNFNFKTTDYQSLIMNEIDLEAKVSCYLNYILDPKYEYVSFWEFWKTSYNLSYPCK